MPHYEVIIHPKNSPMVMGDSFFVTSTDPQEAALAALKLGEKKYRISNWKDMEIKKIRTVPVIMAPPRPDYVIRAAPNPYRIMAAPGSQQTVPKPPENITIPKEGVDAIDALSASNEWAGIISEVSNMKSAAAGFGAVGAVFTGMEALNDLCRIGDCNQQLRSARSEDERKALRYEMFWTVAKLAKTAVCVAVPAAGFIDLYFNTMGMLYKQAQADASRREFERALQAAYERYGRERDALRSGDPLVFMQRLEVIKYLFGMPMAHIVELRRMLESQGAPKPLPVE